MSDAFNPYHKWLGIPPEDQPADYYQLLGLARFESDADVIEGAADRQMAHVRTFHSAQHSATSQQILNELAAAKLCLLDQHEKAAYDLALRHRRSAPISSPAPAPAPTPAPIAVPVASWATVQPLRPAIPTALACTAQPWPMRESQPNIQVGHTRRKRLGLVASTCLAIALIALPVFIGYLIYKERLTAPRAARQLKPERLRGLPRSGRAF